MTANAPTRTKVLRAFEDDDPLSPTFNKRAIDGLDFDTPPTELALVGSTEEWDLVNVFPGGPNGPFAGDTDLNTHQIHIHLLEFQLINRQAFDAADYGEQWALMNGHNPIRARSSCPSSTCRGAVIPPLPYETGLEGHHPGALGDHHANHGALGAAERRGGRRQPGPEPVPHRPDVVPRSDRRTGIRVALPPRRPRRPRHDAAARRSQQLGGRRQLQGRHRRRVQQRRLPRHHGAHVEVAGQTPDTEFGLWDRVNTDTSSGGQWEPQIRYAVNDRVLFDGQLYSALSVFQSQTGRRRPTTTPCGRRSP